MFHGNTEESFSMSDLIFQPYNEVILPSIQSILFFQFYSLVSANKLNFSPSMLSLKSKFVNGFLFLDIYVWFQCANVKKYKQL